MFWMPQKRAQSIVQFNVVIFNELIKTEILSIIIPIAVEHRDSLNKRNQLWKMPHLTHWLLDLPPLYRCLK